MKHIKHETDLKKAINGWLKDVDEALANRNTVAHHRFRVKDGDPVIYPYEARKILGMIKDGKPLPAKGLTDIRKWVEHARATHARGETVLVNLARLDTQMKK